MNVLICVSSLPFAQKTVILGSMIAELLDRPISLFKVVNSESDRETAVHTLEDVGQLIQLPVEETAVSLGMPAQEILSKAESGRYSLVVMGSRTAHNLWEQFVPSVTHRVANQTSVSILVARRETAKLQRVLICTSGHANSEVVVRNGAALARAAQAKVTLLHVGEPLPVMYVGLDEMEETLPELLQSNTPLAQHLKWASNYLVQAQVPAELKLRRGIAVDELLAEAQEGNYDLVVVGARAEYNLLNSLLMGQVTPKIIDNAPCSVLVIRGEL